MLILLPYVIFIILYYFILKKEKEKISCSLSPQPAAYMLSACSFYVFTNTLDVFSILRLLCLHILF